MTLRVGVDLDGVLADLGSILQPAQDRPIETARADAPTDASSASGRFGSALGQMFDTAHLQGAPSDVWREVTATVNFWETLEEIESGVVRQLGELAETHRWETIFLTSRPATEGDTVQRQTQRWLAEKGFRLPSVFVTNGSRGRIAKALALDVVVDDNPENCLDVLAESSARPILVWRGATDRVPVGVRRLGVGSVSTMVECLAMLESLTGAGRGDSLTQRFRRAFGFGTS